MRSLLLAAVLLLAACDQQRQAETTQRTITVERVTTKTTRQVFAPDGSLVELSDVAVTIRTTDADGRTSTDETTETRPPRILAQAGALVGTVVGAATGSAAIGKAAEQGVDWITGLIGAGGMGTVAAGTGYVATMRKRALEEATEELERAQREAETLARHRAQLIDGIERGRDELPDDADERFKAKLAASQDADLQRVVQERTA
jgi:hypothetical protein